MKVLHLGKLYTPEEYRALFLPQVEETVKEEFNVEFSDGDLPQVEEPVKVPPKNTRRRKVVKPSEEI